MTEDTQEPQTPAGARLKLVLADTTDMLGVWYDESARVVLGMEPLDLPTEDGHKDDTVRLLAAALKAEWQPFMRATDDAWVEKARGVMARMFDGQPGQKKNDYLEDIGAIESWSQDWAETFVSIHELPMDFPASMIGQEVEMSLPGPPDGHEVVKAKFTLVGQTRHSVGLGWTTTRLDLVAENGSAFPMRRAGTVRVGGKQIWPIEDPLDSLDVD